MKFIREIKEKDLTRLFEKLDDEKACLLMFKDNDAYIDFKINYVKEFENYINDIIIVKE